MNSSNTRDAFDVLGLAPSFDVRIAELDARQRELSKTLHPDKHAGADAAARRQALNEAINVNEAHRALKDPLRRAEILCKRLGFSSIVETPATMSGEFLMGIMEAREALANAGRAKDLDAVESLADEIRARETATLNALKSGFERALLKLENTDPGPVADPGQAADSEHTASEQLMKSLERPLAELRYYRRFLDEAQAIEDELD